MKNNMDTRRKLERFVHRQHNTEEFYKKKPHLQRSNNYKSHTWESKIWETAKLKKKLKTIWKSLSCFYWLVLLKWSNKHKNILYNYWHLLVISKIIWQYSLCVRNVVLCVQTSVGESGALFSVEGVEGDEVTEAVKLLLSRPQDEELMDQAKASGRQLFADLAPDARKQRIDAVVSTLNNNKYWVIHSQRFNYLEENKFFDSEQLSFTSGKLTNSTRGVRFITFFRFDALMRFKRI